MVRRLNTGLMLLAMTMVWGCGVGPFPGGELEGPEAPLAAAGIPEETTVIRLETRPEAPYSVRVQLFRIDGESYLDPAPDRRWLSHIEADPRVRIQFAGDPAVYRARAEKAQRPEVLAQFEEAAVVLRLISD